MSPFKKVTWQSQFDEIKLGIFILLSSLVKLYFILYVHNHFNETLH
jgi:hypothetical protein